MNEWVAPVACEMRLLEGVTALGAARLVLGLGLAGAWSVTTLKHSVLVHFAGDILGTSQTPYRTVVQNTLSCFIYIFILII
jgi:hypothetical protein